ncbi:MAG: carbon monoxide dehydrogenase subunit G [Sphingomonadales bacterium]|nr:carbon monoxide dehydrogenase subunit G [Sphingomonadales bacterium]
MQMSGEQTIAAPRGKVWEALNDPAVLRQCIPGCQSLEKDGDRMDAVAEIRIGPIGARFKGVVTLSDIDAPNGCTITGQGNGGIAGNAKGGAKVRLSDAPGGGTIVAYDVEAEVGGRMAQLGGPIIDATAKNLAGKFFAKFGEVVGGGAAAAAEAPAAAAAGTAAAMAGAPMAASLAPAPAPAPLWGWVAALVLAILVGFTLGLNGFGGFVVALVVMLVVVAAGAGYEAGRRGGGQR